MLHRETRGEQLRRLRAQLDRLRHDAAAWRAAGKPETAEELHALVIVLRDIVESIARARSRSGRTTEPSPFDP